MYLQSELRRSPNHCWAGPDRPRSTEKRRWCFSVAAHRLLFIICTVLQNSGTDTYAGTKTGERYPNFSIATEILLNFLRCRCQLLVFFLPMNYRSVPRSCPSPFFIFFFSCISFALFSVAKLIHSPSFSCHFYQKRPTNLRSCPKGNFVPLFSFQVPLGHLYLSVLPLLQKAQN